MMLLAKAALGLGGTIVLAGAYTFHEGVIRVDVDEFRSGGSHVHMWVPAAAVPMALHLVPAQHMRHASHQAREALPILRAVLKELKKYPDAEFVEVIDHDLRRPCGLARHKDLYAVADLAGRVTLFDKDFKLVAQLCDQPDEGLRAQNGVPPEKFKEGEFISPHGVRFDAQGNLYVMDWVSTGRVTKLALVH